MFSLTWCGQTPAKKVTLSKFEEYNSGEATADDLIDDHHWETCRLNGDDDDGEGSCGGGGDSYGAAALDNHENGDGESPLQMNDKDKFSACIFNIAHISQNVIISILVSSIARVTWVSLLTSVKSGAPCDVKNKIKNKKNIHTELLESSKKS